MPEGLYLATSEDIQGLVAQGRTVNETIEIARDIAKKLIEAKKVRLYFTWQAAGSHEIWFNGTTKYFTTIPNHPGDIPEVTLRAILKQANVSLEEFLSY